MPGVKRVAVQSMLVALGQSMEQCMQSCDCKYNRQSQTATVFDGSMQAMAGAMNTETKLEAYSSPSSLSPCYYHVTTMLLPSSHIMLCLINTPTSGETYSAVPTNDVALFPFLRSVGGRYRALPLPKSMSLR